MTRFKNGRPFPENLISTTEAAVIASKHPRTIVSWIRKGELAAWKFEGGRGPYLIDKNDLTELLKLKYTPKPYVPQEKDAA